MSAALTQQYSLPHDAEQIELKIWNPDFATIRRQVTKGWNLLVTKANRRGSRTWLATQLCHTEAEFRRFISWPRIFDYRYWRVPAEVCSQVETALPLSSYPVTGHCYSHLDQQLPQGGRRAFRLIAVKQTLRGYWQASTYLNSSFLFDQCRPSKGMTITYWIVPLLGEMQVDQPME